MVNCLHMVDLTTSCNASAASGAVTDRCELATSGCYFYVCMQLLCLKLILKLSQSIILVACKKHLPHEGNCMQQILQLSLPDCQFVLIIPLFFSYAASNKPVSYLDRMIELTKNMLYLLINAARGRAFQGLTSDESKHTTTADTQQSAQPLFTSFSYIYRLYLLFISLMEAKNCNFFFLVVLLLLLLQDGIFSIILYILNL